MLKQPENSDQNRKVDQASVPMSGNPEVEPNGEPSPSLVKVKQAPVRPRGYLKAEQTFLEIIGERFCNQGQVAKCGYSVHRYTEIADKFVRVVQEHFSGKIPSNLPKDSSVYRDNRLLSMLNSVEYFPSTKLNYNERTELIRDNLSIVYRFARERFFCDISGRQMFAERKPKKVEVPVKPPEVDPFLEVEEEASNVNLSESEIHSNSIENDEGLIEQDADASAEAGPAQGASVEPPAAEPVQSGIDAVPAPFHDNAKRKPIEIPEFKLKFLAEPLSKFAFSATVNNYLYEKLKLSTVLDLLNLSRSELYSGGNFGEKREIEVQEALTRRHPALGLLFARLENFPLSDAIKEELLDTRVFRTQLLQAGYAPDKLSSPVPIDNGFRLLLLKEEIITQVGINADTLHALQQKFFEVGFPRRS